MSKSKRSYPGINIQYPISRLILDGSKSVETRTYPIPDQYIGREMILIETPGKAGRFKARMIGIVVFGESFKYNGKKDFYLDEQRHCVSPESPWKWENERPKWGWPIVFVQRILVPEPAPSRRGIKFTKSINLATK